MSASWPSHVRFRQVQTWSVRQAAQFCFAYVSAPVGSRTVKTEPLPGWLVTMTSSPIMRASLRAMARLESRVGVPQSGQNVCSRLFPFSAALTYSQPLSPVVTQHSLPSGLLTWTGLPPAGSRQLCLAHSLNHLVSGHEQFVGHGEPKRLGGREIDDKLELGGLLDRQVGRLRAS
jgi:hypothetical protein